MAFVLLPTSRAVLWEERADRVLSPGEASSGWKGGPGKEQEETVPEGSVLGALHRPGSIFLPRALGFSQCAAPTADHQHFLSSGGVEGARPENLAKSKQAW